MLIDDRGDGDNDQDGSCGTFARCAIMAPTHRRTASHTVEQKERNKRLVVVDRVVERMDRQANGRESVEPVPYRRSSSFVVSLPL